MISTFNKIPNSKIFLVTYETKDIMKDNLKKLQENTNPKKYENIIKNINLISIENFKQNTIITSIINLT